MAELDGAGNITSRFVYGEQENIPSYLIKGGQTYRIITNHLGSPVLVVNSNTGVIAQELKYDTWGNVLTDTNPGFQPFGFAGGHYDEETGLIRFGYRDYDASIGRWTAKDPSGFFGGDTNLYAYVFNDPVGYIDSNGLADHRKNKRKSNQPKHEQGNARRQADRGGEKGDARRRVNNKRPKNYKGKWPPKGFIDTEIPKGAALWATLLFWINDAGACSTMDCYLEENPPIDPRVETFLEEYQTNSLELLIGPVYQQDEEEWRLQICKKK